MRSQTLNHVYVQQKQVVCVALSEAPIGVLKLVNSDNFTVHSQISPFLGLEKETKAIFFS